MRAVEATVLPWHVSRSGRYGWVLASRLASRATVSVRYNESIPKIEFSLFVVFSS